MIRETSIIPLVPYKNGKIMGGIIENSQPNIDVNSPSSVSGLRILYKTGMRYMITGKKIIFFLNTIQNTSTLRIPNKLI
jgi:hypothetical protein